jgi:tetratricopeptide (TPR) repeat protein
MAERIEEPEAEVAAGAPDLSAAAALAVGLKRSGSSPNTAGDAKLDAFLDEQTELVRLQKEHLHEQRELILSRLRWGRFSDRVKAALQVMTAFVGLAAVVAIGAMAWRAHEDHGLRIEAFSVAPDLAQKGLTGQVVASQLLDKLAVLQAKTVTGRPASSYADDWGGDIKVEIPETGVSIGELSRYLREWLGSETRISGEVVYTTAGLAVTARAAANPGATFQGAETDIDKLTQQAAEAIYAQTQPYRYAVYLASSGRQDEALAAYIRLAGSGTPEDRAWAYTGWAEILFGRNQAKQALDLATKALALDPELLPARIAEARSLQNVGRAEEGLTETRRIAADLRTRRGKGIRVEEMAEVAQTAAGEEALARADYQAAVRLLTQEQLTLEGVTGDSREGASIGLVLDHDPASARRIVVSMGGLVPLRVRVVEPESLGDWGALVRMIDEARLQPGGPDFAHLPPLGAARIGRAYAHVGRLPLAATLISPTPLNCDECLRARGILAASGHDWPAADRWFAEAARQAPSIPLAQADWGAALLDKGDVDGAIVKFGEAHRITPHFADPIELWGEALMRKGDYVGAIAKFAEADKYAPRWGRNHLRWGEALMLGGYFAVARGQFETADRMDLSRPDRAALNIFLDRTAKGPLHG